METPVKQRRKRSFWDSKAEACFAELWEQKVDELRGARKNTHVYQEMSSELAKQGYVVSAQDVKYKIANLTAIYRKCKEAIGPSGGSPASWHSYEAVHKVIGAHRINNVNVCVEESIECNSQETNESAPLGVSEPSCPSWTEEFASASPLSSTELAPPSPPSERASSSNVRATRKVNEKLLTMYGEFGKVFKQAVHENLAVNEKIAKVEEKKLEVLKEMRDDNKKLTQGVLDFLSRQN